MESPPDASHSPARPRDLGHEMIHTGVLFQAIVAFGTCMTLGFAVFLQLFDSYYYHAFYYYFVTYLFTSLMAMGIAFIALLQRRNQLDKTQLLLFETVKAGLATTMWMWLLMDTLFGPWRDEYRDDYVAERERVKIAYTLTTIVPLVLLFYTSFAYALLQWRRALKEEGSPGDASGEDRRGATRGEREPLLPRAL